MGLDAKRAIIIKIKVKLIGLRKNRGPDSAMAMKKYFSNRNPRI